MTTEYLPETSTEAAAQTHDDLLHERLISHEIAALIEAQQAGDSPRLLGLHYHAIQRVRDVPLVGADYLFRFAQHEDPGIRVHAAWITAHLTRDQVLLANDIWAHLTADSDEMVREAAQGAITLATDMQYITHEEASRIRSPGNGGLRAECPRDLSREQRAGPEYRFAGYDGPAVYEAD